MNINVLMGDTYPVICEGFKQICLLDNSINLINTVDDGEELVSDYSNFYPDIVIIDFSLKNLNGIEVFKKIRAINQKAKFIFYSKCNDKSKIFSVYNLGAFGFINKTSSPKQVIKAIKTVANGELYYDEKFTKLNYFEFKGLIDSKEKKMTELTSRESEILSLISDGLSNNQIAEKLFISRKTVEGHRRNIRKKLGLVGFSELIRYAIQKDNISD